MNLIANDAHDAGRLLGFALASRSPATSKDYAELLRRYEDEPSLRAITDGVCDGLGLRDLLIGAFRVGGGRLPIARILKRSRPLDHEDL